MRLLLLLFSCAPNTDAPPVVKESTPPVIDTGCEESAWYTDADLDGYGDAATGVSACEAPLGAVPDGSDCDDTNAAVSPVAEEICNTTDDDCDGAVDEDVAGSSTWFADADGDAHGDPTVSTSACDAPDGYVADATDCDDADPATYAGAPESCDDAVDTNCDGSTGYQDLDGDGWPACQECDDADATHNPDAQEVCDADATDEDCDGLVNDDDPDATGSVPWYRDADGDGYGNDALVTMTCALPDGFAASGGDCDDADSWRNPGLAEVCDREDLDEDCSGTADDADVGTDAATFTTYGRDADGDGYGNADRTVVQCDAPAGYVANTEDCDDADAGMSPDDTEICDDVDNDCDGLIDADDDSCIDVLPFYADADVDGWGDPAVSVLACELPTLFVDNDGDCDDANSTIPDATGSCEPGSGGTDSGGGDSGGGETGSHETGSHETGSGGTGSHETGSHETGTHDSGDTGDTGGAASTPIRFVALGDTGDGSAGQYAVAAGMELVCALEGCDFALFLGDNFYPGGVTSTADPQWTDSFELPYAGLDLEFRPVMGNHDWDHTLDSTYLAAQIDYSPLSDKWEMPADYYSYVEGDATFFAIDTHVIDFGAGAAQEVWLPLERATSTTTWNIIYGHHPYISNGPHGNADPNVETFFDDHVCGQYDVYIAGHDHNLQWLEDTCGTAFLVSGGGHSTYGLMGTNPTYFEAASTGFLWVEIDGNTFTGVFYDETGTELFRQTITK